MSKHPSWVIEVRANIEDDDFPSAGDLSSDDEYNKEFLERLGNQTAAYSRILLRVQYQLANSDRVHETGDSLGGIQSYVGDQKERSEALKYIRSEFENMVSVLADELKRIGIPKASWAGLAKTATDECIDSGTSGKASRWKR